MRGDEILQPGLVVPCLCKFEGKERIVVHRQNHEAGQIMGPITYQHEVMDVYYMSLYPRRNVWVKRGVGLVIAIAQ